MLTLNNLTLNINQRNLFNISVIFLPSSIICMQGSNGCGKTSFLRVVGGIQTPTQGEAFYKAIRLDLLQKPYCNYIGHNLALKGEMKVSEHLRFWSSIYNSSEALDVAIHYFNLYDLLETKCYKLSSGSQKLVVLAKLIACQSDLWLLDEVETNLSEENRFLLNNLIIAKANSGGIIIMTSHRDSEIKSAQILNLEDYNSKYFT